MGSRHEANSNAIKRRIQDHTFENEEGEEYNASAFGGFGDYFRRKKLKLQNRDVEIRSLSSNNPPIFRGVVAHVNGYTQPSLNDLHHLIVSHGGGFLQYLDGKTAATHIIASGLTPKKREDFRKYRIVKPLWVVESVKAGRLLPWDSFRLLEEGASQRTLRFEDGNLANQVNSQRRTYIEQTETSWYTSHFKDTSALVGSELPPRLLTVSQAPPINPERTSLSNLPSTTPDGSKETDYGDLPPLDLGESRSAQNMECLVGDEVHEEVNPISEMEAEQGSSEPEYPLMKMSDSKSPPGAAFNDIQQETRKSGSPQTVMSRQDSILVKPNMTPEEYNALLLSDPRMQKSSVVNPDFIQQFYQESRLHHLSTWKAELKAKLQMTVQDKLSNSIGKMPRGSSGRRYILHVDFDCFFAAVSIQKHHPELVDKPVCIAHGMGSGSEIASCNYPAREYGIKNGMWMKSALERCPELQVLHYDYPAYEEASRLFYECLLSLEGIVQSVSIDEALVDITRECYEAGIIDTRGDMEALISREQAMAGDIATQLREEVRAKTGCAVSVGIGGNVLQAKVALRKAKPAGQFQLKPETVLDIIGELEVQHLPGVGYSLGRKLEELGISLVKDIRNLSRERLTSTLGPKTGAKLWEYSRGIDKTEVGIQTIRKSVSAEINWGVRFTNQEQADEFVHSLCEELHRRLVENLVKGKQLTIRIMRRSADAPLEPVKHLGHGECDVFNKSAALSVATNDTSVLGKEAVSMLRSFGFSPGDLRGLGVQMTKLEPVKPGETNRSESGQKQLNFKTVSTPQKAIRHLDPDDLDSPHKGDQPSLHVSEDLGYRPPLNDKSQKPLNLSGTQFLLPSQPNAKVMSELPNDIRSKLMRQPQLSKDLLSSSSPNSRPRFGSSPVALPPQSQLDPEILDALPEDVRAEVLAQYGRSASPVKTDPGSPTRVANTRPIAMKRHTAPPKKRRGRPPKASATGSSSLAQSTFIVSRPAKGDSSIASGSRWTPTAPQEGEEVEEISEDFLAALPEDIRREVLEEQRQTRLKNKAGLSWSENRKTAVSTPLVDDAAPERFLQLPELPERPTFTSKRLSSVAELREAISSWHSEFSSEGPFVEDTAALGHYLARVVLEEKDIDKAVSLANWLAWLINDAKEETINHAVLETGPKARTLEIGDQSCDPDPDPDRTKTWSVALSMIQKSIQDAVTTRGLSLVEFW